MRLDIPFVGPTYVGRSSDMNSQRCINWYVERENEGAKNFSGLYPTPGTMLKTTAGKGPSRSHKHEWNGKCYTVSGSELYELDTDFKPTKIGDLNTSTGWCYLDSSPSQLMVVDGRNGYVYDGTTFSTISDPGFPLSPDTVAYIDGFFLVTTSESGKENRYYKSDVLDALSWNSTAYKSAEANNDRVWRVDTTEDFIWLFGRDSTELHWNTQRTIFPFALIPNGVIEWGVEARESISHLAGNFFWLARNKSGGRVVVNAQGLTVRMISDKDMNWNLGRLTRVDDAVGYAYMEDGKIFYVLTFPTDGVTYCYDVSTKMWHQRGTEKTNYLITRHRSHGYGYFNNKHLVGDFEDGNIYALEPEVYTDNGKRIMRVRRAPIIHNKKIGLRVNRVEIDIEAGVGLNNEDAPILELAYSRDGGHMWSDYMPSSMGKIGEYDARCTWPQLGSSEQWLFEARTVSPVKAVILGAYADMTPKRR